MKFITFTADEALHNRIIDEATINGMSVNAFVILTLRKMFNIRATKETRNDLILIGMDLRTQKKTLKEIKQAFPLLVVTQPVKKENSEGEMIYTYTLELEGEKKVIKTTIFLK